jgi:hypothetical protein
MTKSNRRIVSNFFSCLLELSRDFSRSWGGSHWRHDMKRALTGLLLAGATCAFVVATPAVAQVAGNPGDQHTPTVYTSGVQAQTYGYNPGYTPGYGGPLGPVGVLAAPITAPLAAMSGAVPGGGVCGVDQDFNGRYTAHC